MAEVVQFPPLPADPARLEELREWNDEMLRVWRSRKDEYVRNYILLGRWWQHRHPELDEKVKDLLYSPMPGEPDARLPDPRTVFELDDRLSKYVPASAVWHCMETLRLIRENTINWNVDPARVAIEAQTAVDDLFSLPETLEDRLLAALAHVSERLGSAEVEKTVGTTSLSSPTADENRYAVLEQLEPAHRKAYLSNEYAERKAGKRLKAQEAYDLILDEGFEEKILDECPEFAELHDYQLPTDAGTWKSQLSSARTQLGENRNQRRRGLPEGRSIVKPDEIEYRGDE